MVILASGWLAGTSPAVNRYGAIAFQANTGHLWLIDPLLGPDDTFESMMAGTSPTIDLGGRILIQDSEGFFNGYPDIGSGTIMAAGTSPSGNDQDYSAYQGNNGDLWTTGSCGW